MLHFFLTDYFLRDRSYERYEFFNFELAKWAEYYLSQKIAFHQSNWCAGRVTENPHDILLGNPTYDMPNASIDTGMGNLHRDWVRDNALQPGDVCHPNTYIIFPWVPEFPQEWMPNLVHVESQLLAARKIFALCGQIWIDRTLAKMDNSIQAQVKHKLVQCNIGVATQNLPFVKQKFNPIGQRQLLHISTLGSYKGFGLTCESIQGLDVRLNVASKSLQASPGLVDVTIDGKKYGFNFLGAVSNADPQFNQWVVDNCDFYIHTATMDAQATVILENCARGLIPLVTPESGYASPYAIYLTHNPEENRQIIQQALNLPESELLERSRLVRQHILEEHNWEKIFDKIWDEITDDIRIRSENVELVDVTSDWNLDRLLQHLDPTLLNEIGEAIKMVRPYTMLSVERLFSLYLFAKQVCIADLPGNFVECGTCAGGSAALLAVAIKRYSLRPRFLYAFDTFEGMPDPIDVDRHEGIHANETPYGAGTLKAPIKKFLSQVCQLLDVQDVVIPVKGLFAQTLPEYKSQIGEIAFLHADSDWYESTTDIFRTLYDSVIAGGIIQIDDYGYWEGCRQAIHDFESKHQFSFDLQAIDSAGVWFKKPLFSQLNKLEQVDKFEHLGLRAINWIVFPDWAEPEHVLTDLQGAFRAVFSDPDRDRITLLIDTIGIDPETADGMIAELVVDLLLQENFEVDAEPQISLITEQSQQEWRVLLDRVQARIPLIHDHKTAIAKAGAADLPLKILAD